jgi:hypothetical protein
VTPPGNRRRRSAGADIRAALRVTREEQLRSALDRLDDRARGAVAEILEIVTTTDRARAMRLLGAVTALVKSAVRDAAGSTGGAA